MHRHRTVLAVLAVSVLAAGPAYADRGPTPSDVAPIDRRTGLPAGVATYPGPTSSDVTPIPRGSKYPANTGGARAAGTLDAANSYVQRNFPTTPTPYNEFDAQFQVVTESNAGTSYFTANSFYFDGGSNNGAYVGLQNQLYMPGNQGNVGKGAIFSIWGATNATPAFCTFYCEVVGGTEAGESFISIHEPYQWVQGHVYQIQVQRLPQGATTFVKAFLYDLTTGAAGVGLGEIYVPGAWSGFSNKVIQWQEEYAPNSYNPCTAIPVYRSAFWSAVWMNRTFGDNAFAVNPQSPYIDPNDGAHCRNSASTNQPTWPSGYPTPVSGQVIGATSY